MDGPVCTQSKIENKKRAGKGCAVDKSSRVRNEDGMLSVFLCVDFPLPAMFPLCRPGGLESGWPGLVVG